MKTMSEDKIDTTCEHIKLRLIAAAVGLQQCTKTAANVIPIPDGRVIAIGTPAEVAGRLLDSHLADQSQATKVQAKPEWHAVTHAGQVKQDDKLRFTIGDKAYSQRAKQILNAGTDKEEVIYDKGRNFYFITSMVINGSSNHKNVEVCAAPAAQEVTQQAAPVVLGVDLSRDGIAFVREQTLEEVAQLFDDNPHAEEFRCNIAEQIRSLKVAPSTQQAAKAETAEQALAEMQARKDAAYLERNQVVAALAKCFPSGVARTAIEGWSEDWHGCVYIDLPTGQASWHFHDSQAYLFAGLPPYAGKWDGHTTEEKYERISRLAPTTSTVSAPEEVRNQDWAKWIVQRGLDMPDHACAECVPHGDIIKPGFQCAYHQALALRTSIDQADTDTGSAA